MSFEEWVRTGLPGLVRFATVLCGSVEQGEDMVQDVALKAHRQWDRIQQASSPDAYLRKMVVNQFLSWRRKWARIIPQAEVDAGRIVSDHADAHADRSALAHELAKLPRRQQAVLVLRYYSGLTDHEIADLLGCTSGTVRGYASRGLATLRIELLPTLTVRDGFRHAH